MTQSQDHAAIAAHHESNARLLAIKALMLVRRVERGVTLDSLIADEILTRKLALIAAPVKGSPRSAYTQARNVERIANRYDVKRAKHMRTKHRRCFR